MMEKIKYLHNWRQELNIALDSGSNCDFNRLLYMNIPSTKELKAGKVFPSAARDKYILELKSQFHNLLMENTSQYSLITYFYKVRQYLIYCDMHNSESFTKSSLENYYRNLHQKVLLGELKNSTYSNHRTTLYTIFGMLNLPYQWFNNIVSLPSNDSEPFEAYSQSDLKKLLPFLRALFKQTSAQFLSSPQVHMAAHKAKSTMSFEWQGKSYRLFGAISKMMAAATYLLSYYTYSNSSVLFSLQRPKAVTMTTQEVWYTMPAFKRRAFKLIHIEMGEHTLDIPKYSMSFFDVLLKVSSIIDNKNNGLLLQTCSYNKTSPIGQSMLRDFYALWMGKYFKQKDLRGNELRPVISRFRETGSQITRYYQGDIANNILLDNTESVRKKHYSTGNRHENEGMLQDAAHIRQQQAVDKSSAKEAQEKLKIAVLTIDVSQRASIPQLSRTPNGGSCADPFGKKSEKFNYKVIKHQLSQGEKLACADILECFGCQSQVIVQSVSDIWCLLSFKECIEESLYLHLDVNHYNTNFSKTINFIDSNIIPKINKNILKEAENRLNEEGRHPLWQEAESIIPTVRNKEASL